MIRLSTRANSDRKNLTPKKDTKTKWTFHGVSRHFHPFEVPTKVDAGKPSCTWAQWTWKPSPRSIGFDAVENGQSRQVQRQILITRVPSLLTLCLHPAKNENE